MSQQDLFGRPHVYPIDAGWKEPGQTSAQAAQTIDAGYLRRVVMTALQLHGPMTADEIAARLGIDRLSIRPRLSELSHPSIALVEKTDQTRKNISGHAARVWRVRG